MYAECVSFDMDRTVVHQIKGSKLIEKPAEPFGNLEPICTLHTRRNYVYILDM